MKTITGFDVRYRGKSNGVWVEGMLSIEWFSRNDWTNSQYANNNKYLRGVGRDNAIGHKIKPAVHVPALWVEIKTVCLFAQEVTLAPASTEIWEGDIIKHACGIDPVEWKEGRWAVAHMSLNQLVNDPECGGYSVIGNAVDNPQMLLPGYEMPEQGESVDNGK